MGTTKLTRKEIRSKDPVRENILRMVEFVQTNRSKIGIAVVAVIVLAFGLRIVNAYLGSRAEAAEAMLGRGMAFFSAVVSPDASEDNPYAEGGTPRFLSDDAKYEAAAKEFTAAASSFGAGETKRTARYYLGLTQLQLGKKEDAKKNLESAAFGSGNRTVGFIAKQALADYYADSGDAKGAEDLLRGMINDARCDIPKEHLSMQLADILAAEGKRDEAIVVLRDASEASPVFGVFNQQLLAEIERLQRDVP